MISPCVVQTTIPVPRTSGRVVSLFSFFCAGATPLGERTVAEDAGNFFRKYHSHLKHIVVLYICRIPTAQLSILVEIYLLNMAICRLLDQLWSRSLQGVNKIGMHWSSHIMMRCCAQIILYWCTLCLGVRKLLSTCMPKSYTNPCANQTASTFLLDIVSLFLTYQS